MFRSSSSPRRYPGRQIPDIDDGQVQNPNFQNRNRDKLFPEIPEIHFPFDEDEVRAIEYRLCSINNLLKSKGFPGLPIEEYVFTMNER
jgi:hypothetical protein